MARQIRKKSGTGIYHMMLIGINRQDIFEDDADYLQMSQGIANPLEHRGTESPCERIQDLWHAVKNHYTASEGG